MRLAASLIEPVSATSSSSSILPGPNAISLPRVTRKRGSNESVLADFDLTFMMGCRFSSCQREVVWRVPVAKCFASLSGNSTHRARSDCTHCPTKVCTAKVPRSRPATASE